MPGSVFVSYSRADRAYVKRLVEYLADAGIDVWWDHHLAAGEKWVREVEKGIDASDAFVVVLTPAAATSDWVFRETYYAHLQKKVLYPLWLEGPEKAQLILAGVHREDVRGGRLPSENFIRQLGGRVVSAANSSGPRRGTVVGPAEPGRRGAILRGHTRAVQSVTFSPDGVRLASAGTDQAVRLWDVAAGVPAGEPLTGHTKTVWSVAFRPRSAGILATASHDRSVRLWKASSLGPVGQPLTGHARAVTVAAYSPDGLLLATGSYDTTVRLWKAGDGSEVGAPLTGSGGPVRTVAFSPSGSLLAGAGQDGVVRLWNPDGGRVHRELDAGVAVTSVAFSPNAPLLAAAGQDGTVRLWHPGTRALVHLLRANQTGATTSVAFSPSGDLLATAGEDRAIHLWDPAAGRPASAALTGHSGAVTSVAFSPDGRLLASGSTDKTVRVWLLDQKPGASR